MFIAALFITDKNQKQPKCPCNGGYMSYICQPHRMYNTKSNTNLNYGFQQIIRYQYWLIDYNKVTALKQDVKGKCEGGKGI